MRDKREFYGQCVRASSMLPMQWLGGRQFVYLGGQQVVHGTSCQGCQVPVTLTTRSSRSGRVRSGEAGDGVA